VTSIDAKKLPAGTVLVWMASPIWNIVELIEIEMYGNAGRWIIRPIATISHVMRPVNGELPVYARDLMTLHRFVEKKPEFLHRAISSIFDKRRSLL
jgi:hypothetical protein